MPTPIIVQSEHLSEAPRQWLAARCRLVRCPQTDAGFAEALREAEGLIVRTYTVVAEDLLAQAPRLRVIGRAGAGLDNIDLDACRARGVAVVYTPDANTRAVIEFVLRILLEAIRPATALTAALDEAQWSRARDESGAGRQLSDLTLGILGLGRVGRRLAEVSRAIGTTVIYNDLIEIEPAQRHGAAPVDVEELFARADVLSVHVDGRAENRGFVSKRLIRRMKDDVVFVNTSRGFVVDAAALAALLREHPSATALLDVHEPEPFGRDYALLGVPNARLYPHIASRTGSAMENMSWVVRDVWAVLEGEQPRWPAVDMATGQGK